MTTKVSRALNAGTAFGIQAAFDPIVGALLDLINALYDDTTDPSKQVRLDTLADLVSKAESVLGEIVTEELEKISNDC